VALSPWQTATSTNCTEDTASHVSRPVTPIPKLGDTGELTIRIPDNDLPVEEMIWTLPPEGLNQLDAGFLDDLAQTAPAAAFEAAQRKGLMNITLEPLNLGAAVCDGKVGDGTAPIRFGERQLLLPPDTASATSGSRCRSTSSGRGTSNGITLPGMVPRSPQLPLGRIKSSFGRGTSSSGSKRACSKTSSCGPHTVHTFGSLPVVGRRPHSCSEEYAHGTLQLASSEQIVGPLLPTAFVHQILRDEAPVVGQDHATI